MCLNISLPQGQWQIHQTRRTWWFKLVLPFILLSTLPQNGFTQNSDGINIRTVDMRGDNPVLASVAAIKNSRNHVVVVLMKGASEELIEKTKDNLKALVHKGYNRIGIILCDFKPGETLPVIGIASDGTIYAAIKGAKSNSKTMKDVYNAVSEAYQKNILPILENSPGQKN